ncbi:MAG: PHP domain-containing protein [Chloroflexi bacterium]|nr:PHP domain-containing protein [Chloroflexota bacterium]
MTLSKADTHIHTTFSDGLMTPEAVVEYAATETQLSVIAITDHDTIAGAVAAQRYWRCYQDDFGHLDVIIGSEITSRDGDIVGLFLNDDVPAGMSAAETVHAIHAQGGIAIAVHPYSFLLPMIIKGVKGHIHSVSFDGVEIRNGTPTEFFSNYFTEWINRRRALPEVGGSDAHYLPTTGQAYTLFPGRTGADFRRAIQTGQTQAKGQVYSFFTLAQVATLSLLGRMPLAEPSTARSIVC